MRVFVFALALLLTGCSTSFEVVQKRQTVTVTWLIVDNVDETCRQNGARTNVGQKILGCAGWTADFSHCTIITGKTTTHEILGHELRHCYEGKWHD